MLISINVYARFVWVIGYNSDVKVASYKNLKFLRENRKS